MSNNHSLEERNVAWPITLASNILVVLGFVFIANWIGSLFMELYSGKAITGADLASIGADSLNLKNTLLAGQIGGTFFGFIVLPLVYLFYAKKDIWKIVFVKNNKNIVQYLTVAFVITFAVLPLVGVIGDWNKGITFPSGLSAIEAAMRLMEDRAAVVTKLIVQYTTTGEMLVVLFTVALLPAVSEELVFRGILQNDLIRSTGNVHLSVFISATVFSFIHFQFFGFFPRLLLGLVLGYLYITSGNILVSMLMHFVNNAMVVIAMNLYSEGKIQVDPESSKDLPVASIYISLILSLALLYWCWRMYKQRTDIEQSNV